MRTCTDCGEVLSDLAPPCPACGSERQSAAVHARVAMGSATALPATVGLSFNSDQPWYAQWLNVRQHLEAAEAACQPSSYRGNDVVKKSIENFFIQCFHMGDWLWEDQSRTGLTKPEVCKFIEIEPSLRICEGIANTDKHRVRSKKGAITARVQSISPGSSETQVLIEWSQQGLPRKHTEDALDLARRCVDAWEGYLKDKGLHSPV